MNYMEYLGYKIEDLCCLLDSNNIDYIIKQTWDTKKTKLGNEERVVKITKEKTMVLYTAFF